jgi:hypothetical protein
MDDMALSLPTLPFALGIDTCICMHLRDGRLT